MCVHLHNHSSNLNSFNFSSRGSIATSFCFSSAASVKTSHPSPDGYSVKFGSTTLIGISAITALQINGSKSTSKPSTQSTSLLSSASSITGSLNPNTSDNCASKSISIGFKVIAQGTTT